MEKYLWILLGILIGWLTKIPFVLRYYADYQRHRRSLEKLNHSIQRRFDEEKEANLLKQNQNGKNA